MPSQLIMWLITACAVLLIIIAFSSSARGRIFFQSIVGVCGIAFFNWILTPLGLSVGINLISILVAGILGLPGLFLLYLTQVIL